MLPLNTVTREGTLQNVKALAVGFQVLALPMRLSASFAARFGVFYVICLSFCPRFARIGLPSQLRILPVHYLIHA